MINDLLMVASAWGSASGNLTGGYGNSSAFRTALRRIGCFALGSPAVPVIQVGSEWFPLFWEQLIGG